MKPKKTTIGDIARKANLSKSTVSRALNDHPRISLKTKAEVKSIAEKLNYSPDLFARGLIKRKTFLIGLMGDDFTNEGLNKIAISAQKTIEDSGYWAITANAMSGTKRYHDIIRSWINIGVDGILHTTVSLEEKEIENLIDSKFPIVFVNRRLKSGKGDHVIFDFKYGTYLGVNHLLNLGYRRIGFINGPLIHSTSFDRFKGYQQALDQRKIKLDNSLIKEGRYDQESGYNLGNQLIALKNRPQAIFCCDDYVAIGVIKALAENGIKIPDEMAIIGMDDIKISSHPLFQLTTVKEDLEGIGKLGARLLIDRIEGKLTGAYKKVKFEPHLIIRHSCGYKRAEKG